MLLAMPRRITALVLGMLLLGACADRGGAPPAGTRTAPPGDIRGEWVVSGLSRDGEDLPLPGGVEGTLAVEERRLGGRSFCNSFGAGYELDGDRLSLEDLLTSLVACTGTVGRAEGAYLAALGSGDVRVAATDEGFLLVGDGVEVRLRPRPPVRAPDLAGRTWRLQGVTDDGVSTIALGPAALLAYADDGSWTASTGCRSLSGAWTLAQDRVTPVVDRAEGDCPAELVEQDAVASRVLGGPYGVRIADGRLLLTGPDGLGLEYVEAGA